MACPPGQIGAGADFCEKQSVVALVNGWTKLRWILVPPHRSQPLGRAPWRSGPSEGLGTRRRVQASKSPAPFSVARTGRRGRAISGWAGGACGGNDVTEESRARPTGLVEIKSASGGGGKIYNALSYLFDAFNCRPYMGGGTQESKNSNSHQILSHRLQGLSIHFQPLNNLNKAKMLFFWRYCVFPLADAIYKSKKE